MACYLDWGNFCPFEVSFKDDVNCSGKSNTRNGMCGRLHTKVVRMMKWTGKLTRGVRLELSLKGIFIKHLISYSASHRLNCASWLSPRVSPDLLFQRLFMRKYLFQALIRGPRTVRSRSCIYCLLAGISSPPATFLPTSYAEQTGPREVEEFPRGAVGWQHRRN